MAETKPFSYEGILAKNVPAGRRRGAAKRGKYDFAVAYPDPASIPFDGLVEGLKQALAEEGRDLAVYATPQGYEPLREFVAEKLGRDRDIHVSADDIILGDGSGQPIHMICETLLNPGDVVLTEDYVYSGTLGQLRRFQADIRGVPTDQEGMLPDALESIIKKAIGEGKRPKFIYTIPTFQNPQGWTMTLARRKAMVALSQKYDVPILEDDCYVDLRYDGEDVTSLYALDGTGRVMYVASFSKIIAPGMRLGYMTAPQELLDRAIGVKSGGSVNSFAAYAVHRYVTGQLDAHIEEINGVQREKRDAMVSALGENFGNRAEWSHPDGGLFIWLKMPEGADVTAIRDRVLDRYDVGYHAGPNFAPDGVSGRNYARLCFGYNTPEEIREGIARLAEGFEKEGALR
ncbi:MAG: PLP-dependent aminotransferase family protein [Chloroflexi bacterium]|nr:PLP-dependent aminotransferase family protein [Chloroflexota bacterium]